MQKKMYILIIILLIVVGGFITSKYINVGDIVVTNDINNDISCIYTYTGDINANGIEIDEVIKLESDMFEQKYLEIIKDRLIEKHFSGIDIKITSIEKNILTIDLINKEKQVVEYVNAGSTGSKICSDILRYSFLQPESNVKNWIKGLKILVNGEADIEGDHFNFMGIYNRQPRNRIMATIKDYGYSNNPIGYEDEYIVNSNAQKFVINPVEDETEIIISEAVYSEYGFYEGKELYRTDKSLLFVMELPEGIPDIIVKLKNKDRTSTWVPMYNGKDGSLIVPAEFDII